MSEKRPHDDDSAAVASPPKRARTDSDEDGELVIDESVSDEKEEDTFKLFDADADVVPPPTAAAASTATVPAPPPTPKAAVATITKVIVLPPRKAPRKKKLAVGTPKVVPMVDDSETESESEGDSVSDSDSDSDPTPNDGSRAGLIVRARKATKPINKWPAMIVVQTLHPVGVQYALATLNRRVEQLERKLQMAVEGMNAVATTMHTPLFLNTRPKEWSEAVLRALEKQQKEITTLRWESATAKSDDEKKPPDPVVSMRVPTNILKAATESTTPRRDWEQMQMLHHLGVHGLQYMVMYFRGVATVNQSYMTSIQIAMDRVTEKTGCRKMRKTCPQVFADDLMHMISTLQRAAGSAVPATPTELVEANARATKYQTLYEEMTQRFNRFIDSGLSARSILAAPATPSSQVYTYPVLPVD